MSDLLLWCDLETAGLDESTDSILEVAVVVTRPDLTELESYESAIWPGHWGSMTAELPFIEPEVVRMHTDSGLLDACALSGVPLHEAEGRICSILGDLGVPPEFVLAGSGVSHFDRRFINRQMPGLASWLRYYPIDVGVLRRTLELFGHGDLIGSAPLKPHRAMADIRLHIEEFRNIKDSLDELIRDARSWHNTGWSG